MQQVVRFSHVMNEYLMTFSFVLSICWLSHWIIHTVYHAGKVPIHHVTYILESYNSSVFQFSTMHQVVTKWKCSRWNANKLLFETKNHKNRNLQVTIILKNKKDQQYTSIQNTSS